MIRKEINPLTQRLVDVVEQFLRKRKEADYFDVHGRVHVEELMRKFVEKEETIEFVLPAFPFKSPSHHKVLGTLPDFGEYYSLFVLNSLCQSIQDIYAPGATMTLASDGSVYHDIVGVSQDDFIAYDEEVRRIGKEFSHLRFVCIRDMMTDEQFAMWSRDKEEFFQAHLEGYDLESDLATNENLLQVYRGYLLFMKDDLQTQIEKMDLSSKKQRKFLSTVAKQLLRRGQVYSELLSNTFPQCIRLSIHGHNNTGPKFAVALSPQLQCRTPWHNCVVLRRTGKFELMKVRDVPDDATVITKHGRPWMMAEPDPDLLHWDTIDGKVKWEALLPFGLQLEFPPNTPLEAIPGAQLRRLALKFKLVNVRGLRTIENQQKFDDASSSFGTPQSWFFGNVLTVKLNPALDVNNVLSNEAMPMHYDGLFKIGEDGKPMAPAFQYFFCKVAAGSTLFTNTELFHRIYPSLKEKKWKVFTPKNDSFGGTEMILDLFEEHPRTKEIIFRFHEPWGQEKTQFKPTEVEVMEKENERWCQRLTDIMYSRRFCIHHQWQENDVIIADNISLMHTRPAYDESARELWRIHYN